MLIRVLVGWVFLSEGIQKFLYPDALGVGRFVKIGIPWPQVMAPFVGVVEIICGALLLIGLMTRFATVPLLIDIGVALYSTKIAASFRPAELLYRRHQRSQVPSRSTSKQPRVNANGNGPGSLVRYDPSKKTSVRSPISSLN